MCPDGSSQSGFQNMVDLAGQFSNRLLVDLAASLHFFRAFAISSMALMRLSASSNLEQKDVQQRRLVAYFRYRMR
jgi:hypothetical protein